MSFVPSVSYRILPITKPQKERKRKKEKKKKRKGRPNKFRSHFKVWSSSLSLIIITVASTIPFLLTPPHLVHADRSAKTRRPSTNDKHVHGHLARHLDCYLGEWLA